MYFRNPDNKIRNDQQAPFAQPSMQEPLQQVDPNDFENYTMQNFQGAGFCQYAQNCPYANGNINMPNNVNNPNNPDYGMMTRQYYHGYHHYPYQYPHYHPYYAPFYHPYYPPYYNPYGYAPWLLGGLALGSLL